MLESVLVGPVGILINERGFNGDAPTPVPLYKMSQESRYMVLCVDPVPNKVVLLNSEGKKASKPPTEALVRMTTDPAKLTNLVYQDKSTTVEVVPLDMNRIIPMPFPFYQLSSVPTYQCVSVPAYHLQEMS